jgi:hypothetical protein
MAQFIKTPEVWNLSDTEIQALQPGQWVTCGGSLGRFVGNTPASTWIVHRESKIDPVTRKLLPLTVPQEKFLRQRATFNPDLRARMM